MPSVLLAVLVYNGRAFVPQALESVQRCLQNEEEVSLHAVVLDDCSPDPGWSEDLRSLCKKIDVEYYRSPRNLGIPRNMNMALTSGVRNGFDYVILANSDVVFPSTVASDLVATANSSADIGSVTAWSNSVSIYSFRNEDPQSNLRDPAFLDWISCRLAEEYHGGAMDIPTGVGFCMLIPTPVIKAVGLMDPIFGRGYCEEVDWCLRAQSLGYRNVLCPGTYVYHLGNGSTDSAGILAPGKTTVDKHEAIIDYRYPQFRSQVAAFVGGNVYEPVQLFATDRILRGAASEQGYRLALGSLAEGYSVDDGVNCQIDSDGLGKLIASYRGFSREIPTKQGDFREALRAYFGSEPSTITILDPGRAVERVRAAYGSRVEEKLSYPRKL